MRTIMRLQSKCGITGKPLDADLRSIYAQYKQVIFDYRAFRKIASTTRTIFQDVRIEELAPAGNTEASAVRRRVKHTEESRSLNRRIQAMLGNNRGTGVTRVDKVDSVTNEVIQCTTKSDIERANIEYLST